MGVIDFKKGQDAFTEDGSAAGTESCSPAPASGWGSPQIPDCWKQRHTRGKAPPGTRSSALFPKLPAEVSLKGSVMEPVTVISS